MNFDDKLREAIRATFEQHLDEISTTANVAGYLTPNAFVGDKHGNTDRVRQLAKRIGYTLTKRGEKDTKAGDPLTENKYYEYKNDQSALPHQKIGKAISEINKQIKMVERALHFNNRLKNEYGVSNEKLWKRTQNQMTKLEGRLMEMARRLREMRG
jgi:hypothetical protein